MKTRVLIADDHQVVREGFRALLATQPDIEVVGQAENGEEAVARALECKPDVILMDLSMPVLNGLEATRLLHQTMPETAIIIVTSSLDADSVQHLLDAGAIGYMTKQSAATDLSEAVRSARKKMPFFSPEVLKVLEEAKARQFLN
jgi:DNA-binding NarL/FixJ family response regulator